MSAFHVGAVRAFLLTVACSVLVVPQRARAQGFDLQGTFESAGSVRTDYLTVESGSAALSRTFELSLMNHFSRRLLSMGGAAGDVRVVDYQLVHDLVVSIAPVDRFRLTVDLPMYSLQSGTNGLLGVSDDQIDRGGLGDVRVVPKVGLLMRSGSGSALAFVLPVTLPTGSQRRLQGEGLTIEPRLAYDYVTGGGVGIGVNAGFVIRNARGVDTLTINDAVRYGLALRIPLRADLVDLIVEGRGDISVSEGATASPHEADGALRFYLGHNVLTVGGGAGFGDGYGAPRYRVFLGFGVAPVRDTSPVDTDGDGLVDDQDACPLDPEDMDGFEDADGCPDVDNDGDGMLDVEDGCPTVPEDIDTFEDFDGCPDPDNDNDGILDMDDECAFDPEDLDGFEDADGCPDVDNDGDGILDVDDACPDVAEDMDGFEDADGCPEMGPNASPVLEGLERIDQVIFFDTDSDRIRSGERRKLDVIVALLEQYPNAEILIIGFADERGAEDYNAVLSAERASAVHDALVSRGISAERLFVEGRGEVSSGLEDEAGWQSNRRVELEVRD